MMTVFLFARLWVRAGLLTDVEFAEMRYAGKPGAFLRGFRAIYLGLLVNCVILGWVTKAMTTIAAVVLGVERPHRAGALRFLPDSVHGNLCRTRRPLGRSVDRPVSVCSENGRGHRRRVVRRCRRGRNARAPRQNRGAPHRRRARTRPNITSFFPGFFARLRQRIALDHSCHHFLRVSRRAVVGVLVSGIGTGRRRLRRAANSERAQ